SIKLSSNESIAITKVERPSRVHESRSSCLPHEGHVAKLDLSSAIRRSTWSTVVLVNVIHAGDLADFCACKLPGPLHNPGKGAIKTRSLVFDLLKHDLREVQALLSLVATGAGRCRLVCHLVNLGLVNSNCGSVRAACRRLVGLKLPLGG